MRFHLACALALTTLLVGGCAADADTTEGDAPTTADEDLKAAPATYRCVNDEDQVGIGFSIEAQGMQLWWLDEAREIGTGKIDPKYKPTNPDNRAFAAYKGFPELIDSHDPGSIVLLVEKPLLRRALKGTAKLRSTSEHGGFFEYVLACERH